MLPLATALVAWADGEHWVRLAADRDGARVVLGHDAGDPRKALTHSHCLISQMLTLLAQPSGPEHADHILNFQSGASTARRDVTIRLAVTQVEVGLAFPPSAHAVASPRLLSNVEAPLLDIPPPAMAVVVAGATVLLI
ncbi:MAG TPA: hypothetical protein VNO52_09480 [Methylomirabilota bacterium]|nr:hypothetical protein [Methylomirabilota bacterium]